MQHVLIVSNGPVPVIPNTKIEGGGQRAWGLAQGLAAHGNKVTIAVPAIYSVENSKTKNPSISLINWSTTKELAHEANKRSAIIVSYSMGKRAYDIVSKVESSVLVVLDCYVPIYVEVSARRSNNPLQSLANYLIDLKYYNRVLERGDYFLYANNQQGHFYTGVLSALGALNPSSYNNKRLLLTPSGIEQRSTTKNINNPYKLLGIDDKDFVMLWFGGLYPWFNITPLLQAINKLNDDYHLVIVGGKNPYNQNEDINKQYHLAIDFAKENNLTAKKIHFVDWVDYEDRINWYARADVVISLNAEGDENNYSWRTRVMDFIWGGAAIVTNGGDPLSDELLQKDAAIKIDMDDTLYSQLRKLKSQKALLETTKRNVNIMSKNYTWDKVTVPLHSALQSNQRPYATNKSKLKKVKFKVFRSKIYTTTPGRALLYLPRRVKSFLN